jgi:hypothetical protein
MSDSTKASYPADTHAGARRDVPARAAQLDAQQAAQKAQAAQTVSKKPG